MTTPEQLYDPRLLKKPVRIENVQHEPRPLDPSRTNYFTIYSIESGEGEFWADAARHPLAAGSLLFFTPYQYIRLLPTSRLKGAVIQFHANFLCVETFHAESGCAGILFNDPYSPPIVPLDATARREVGNLVEQMLREQTERALGYEEMLLAYVKVLLIRATRIKAGSTQEEALEVPVPRHPVLGPLKELIEQNYRSLHSPSDYADLLHMAPKTLGRIVREQLGKSLTDLIRERILTHAKWQLLHTLRPVKEIARELGFRDELYFSRLFKKSTGFSPTFFRQFETEIHGGSNLSMNLAPAPIQTNGPSSDDSDR